ncbi:MAG: hypothetical protein IJA14_03680 [Alphaproteobacteria bacterium]|nr:hypothetical protein [Alphaproteobacteria bacterium]
MLKNVLAAFFFCTIGTVIGWEYRGDSFETLSNNIDLVVLNSTKSNSVYIVVGFSRMKSDDFRFPGAEEVLGTIFEERLGSCVGAEEANSYVDQDKILLAVFGEKSKTNSYIKKIKECITADISSEELQSAQEKINIKLRHDRSLDKIALRQDVQNSLHKSSLKFTEDDVAKLTLSGINFVKNKYCEQSRLKVIVASNEKSDSVKNALIKNFEKKELSEQEQSKKFNNSDSKEKLTRNSSQLSVPLIEMSWKVPGYKNDAKKTAKLELILLYLNERLRNTFVKQMKVARFFDITYSLWNSECCEVKVSVIPANKVLVKDIESMILYGIRALSNEELAPKKFQELKDALVARYDVFNFRCDVIDTTNWVAERLNAGFSYVFLKGFVPLIKNIENEKILKTSIGIFDNDPDVVAELIPKGDS